MQHASDNWWVSSLVVLLAVIIIYKVLTAQAGKRTDHSPHSRPERD